jgi:hypothetical protein
MSRQGGLTQAGEVGRAPGDPGPEAGQGEPLALRLAQLQHRAVPACAPQTGALTPRAASIQPPNNRWLTLLKHVRLRGSRPQTAA